MKKKTSFQFVQTYRPFQQTEIEVKFNQCSEEKSKVKKKVDVIIPVCKDAQTIPPNRNRNKGQWNEKRSEVKREKYVIPVCKEIKTIPVNKIEVKVTPGNKDKSEDYTSEVKMEVDIHSSL